MVYRKVVKKEISSQGENFFILSIYGDGLAERMVVITVPVNQTIMLYALNLYSDVC